MIGVAVDDAPAFALRPLLAEANLILDRGVALQVGGIAGVDGGGRHGEGLSYHSPCRASGCLSVGVLAAESDIISLGGGAGKQLYQLDEQRIGRGGGVPRLFCLPILLTLAHATQSGATGRASFPRGILAQNRHCLSAVPAGRRGSAPRRPGAHQRDARERG